MLSAAVSARRKGESDPGGAPAAAGTRAPVPPAPRRPKPPPRAPGGSDQGPRPRAFPWTWQTSLRGSFTRRNIRATFGGPPRPEVFRPPCARRSRRLEATGCCHTAGHSALFWRAPGGDGAVPGSAGGGTAWNELFSSPCAAPRPHLRPPAARGARGCGYRVCPALIPAPPPPLKAAGPPGTPRAPRERPERGGRPDRGRHRDRNPRPVAPRPPLTG